MGDNQSLIINSASQVKNLFIEITDYPNFIRGQGGTGTVQESATAVTTDTNYKDLLLYKTETNYPNTIGELIRVWYEISFRLLANTTTADVTYQLQARDKGDGDWVNMSAEVEDDAIGTSYATKLVKGFLDIQDGISKLPFEIRLRIKSSESAVDVLKAFSCSWSKQSDWGQHPRAILQLGDNLYCGVDNSIYYQTGTENWSQMTFTTAVYKFGVSDCLLDNTDKIYCATNSGVWELSDTTWSLIGNSPTNVRSLVHFNGKLYAGKTDGNVEYTSDETTWASAGQPGSAAVNDLVVFGSALYAALSDGNVYKMTVTDTTWAEVGAGDLTGADEVLCLCVHDSELYAGTSSGSYNDNKIFVFDADLDSWTDTGSLEENYNYKIFGMVSFDKEGKGAVLYAATGNSANVFYLNGEGNWINTGGMSGDYQVLSIAAYDKTSTVYAGTNNYGRMYKGNITETWLSGEATGIVRNDEASDGQKTKFEIVGRVI